MKPSKGRGAMWPRMARAGRRLGGRRLADAICLIRLRASVADGLGEGRGRAWARGKERGWTAKAAAAAAASVLPSE